VEHADTADEIDIVIALLIPDFGVPASFNADGMNDAERITDVREIHVAFLWDAYGQMRTESRFGLQTKKSALSIPLTHALS
ncbi:hypothetical protein NPJ88_014065, partial [Halomonas elongata]|uniref:hypothetical protein n=1 Tax=Halomonas elongata TaxID=2746 RepID=UPI00255B32D5